MLGVLHTYTYDKNGNITFEKIGEGDDVEYKSYLYDEHNRMTRYNDSELGITITYTYDNRGNITNYTIYEYSAYTNPVNTSTAYAYNYLYKDETWKDLATSIHGKSISYDEIGNPENWLYGKTFEWENGRQLKSVKKSSSNVVNYTYNGDGLRLGKSGARNSEYIIVDDTYLGERTTIDGTTYLITYIYGGDGSVMGIDVNSTAYYFVKNLQGDVTAIIDANGNVKAKYFYDAYGFDMGITDANGNNITSATHIAHLNPFRYRGYMYDEETGFYYLTTRYYDPEVCRFLNADGYSSTGQGFDGNNMFVYCLNNPVLYCDTTGSRCEQFAGAVGHFDPDTYIPPAYNGSISSNEWLTGEQLLNNAEVVYKRLTVYEGWSHNAACAVLGNMTVESSINPGKWQDNKSGCLGPGYGIVQWDPSTKYTDWADSKGYIHGSMFAQLEFLVYSMQPGRGEYFSNGKYPGYYLNYNDFINSTLSVEYLTLVFLWSYERPSDPHSDERIDAAIYWDNYFGG